MLHLQMLAVQGECLAVDRQEQHLSAWLLLPPQWCVLPSAVSLLHCGIPASYMPQMLQSPSFVSRSKVFFSHASGSNASLARISLTVVPGCKPRRKLLLPSEFALGESTDSLLLSNAALAALSAAGLGFLRWGNSPPSRGLKAEAVFFSCKASSPVGSALNAPLVNPTNDTNTIRLIQISEKA